MNDLPSVIRDEPVKFDHLGIVVENIQSYYSGTLKALFGVEKLSPIYADPLQNCYIAFATTSNGVRLELIQPMNEKSPVSETLKRRRGGLHHFCFEAETQLRLEIAKLEAAGCKMVSEPKPAIAFENRKVVFFMLPSCEIVELVEAG